MKTRRVWVLACLAVLALGLVFAALWFTAPRPLDDFSDNFDFSQTVRISGDAVWHAGAAPGSAPEARAAAMELTPGDPAFESLVDFLGNLRCPRTLSSLLPRPKTQYSPNQEGSFRWELRLSAPEGPDPGLLVLSSFGGRVTLACSRAGRAGLTSWYIDLGGEEQDWVLAFIQEHGQQIKYE